MTKDNNTDRQAITHEMWFNDSVVLADIFTEAQKYRLQRHLERNTRTKFFLPRAVPNSDTILSMHNVPRTTGEKTQVTQKILNRRYS